MINEKSALPNLRNILDTALKLLPENITPEGVLNCIDVTLSQCCLKSCYIINSEWLAFLGLNKSFCISICSEHAFPAVKYQDYSVFFLLQKNLISKETIPYLQLLDLIALSKKTCETTTSGILPKFTQLIQDLAREEKRLLAKLSRKYAPYVRSVLALVFEAVCERTLAIRVANTLNPDTFKKYKQKFSLY